MKGLPYYKAYPRDFMDGTIGMSFELKGAYRLVIDLIYMQAGRLADDERYISGMLGCTIKKWNSLRGQLISMGKITVNGDFLTNARASIELVKTSELLHKLQQNGAKGGEKRAENLSKLAQNSPETRAKFSGNFAENEGGFNKNNDLAVAIAPITRVNTDTDTYIHSFASLKNVTRASKAHLLDDFENRTDLQDLEGSSPNSENLPPPQKPEQPKLPQRQDRTSVSRSIGNSGEDRRSDSAYLAHSEPLNAIEDNFGTRSTGRKKRSLYGL